jgi:hypothetical protein
MLPAKVLFILAGTLSWTTLQPQLFPETEPPTPPACAQVKLTASAWDMADHVPYPVSGEPWPVDLASAEIIVDPISSSIFLPRPSIPRPSIDEVRERLTRYRVLTGERWRNNYSHVGGLDHSGWLIGGGVCYRWTLRPGGLAWVTYPDGTAVHLAGCCH